MEAKKLLPIIGVVAVVAIAAFALSLNDDSSVTVDYADAEALESDLNAGKDVTGKVVTFTVREVIPDSFFGYNLVTGEHLNFCSTNNPKVGVGDTVTVKITEVSSMLGSYIISYEKV